MTVYYANSVDVLKNEDFSKIYLRETYFSDKGHKSSKNIRSHEAKSVESKGGNVSRYRDATELNAPEGTLLIENERQERPLRPWRLNDR
jgi:hypothetical protein